MFRQRRRQALEKQTRPRSTSPLHKGRRGRAASRSKSSQGKVITVQPVKKTRKVEKGLQEKRREVSEPVSKKSRPNKQQTVQRAALKKEKKESVSLSESELDLSEISDEEQYFRVERSPEPIALTEVDHRETNKDIGHRVPSKGRGHVEPSNSFEDVLPGPPTMRHITERTGRKLHEVDQLIAAYRSGGSTFDKALHESGGGRQAGQGSARQQNTIGVQVSEETKPSQVKSVGFFHSGFPDRVGLGNTFKVSSSSQTDQPTPRSPPVRRDRVLVTSGVQTEKRSVEADHVISHAPILPPDIFLNLQMPKPDQDRVLPPESVIDYDQSVTDPPVSIRGRQTRVIIGGETGGVPPVLTTDVDQVSSNVPMDVRGRQFLSVADIDHDQWLEVQSAPVAAADEKKSAEVDDEEREEEERSGSVGTETGFSSRKGKYRMLGLTWPENSRFFIGKIGEKKFGE